MTTVIVTGAGQGIGAATARLLADSGVRVIGVDRSDEPAEDLSGTEYVPLDVTDAVAWAAFAERLHGRGERVDD